MKRLVIILVLFLALTGCEKIKSLKPAEKPESEALEEGVKEVDALEVEAEEVEPASEIPDTELGFMVAYEGKYAGQEDLFENEVLAARLRNLERFNYDAMLERWNTETPIVIEEGVLHMSGCKSHDCPSSAYDFFWDIENDNLNIFHFRENMLRIYQEKGWIELPPGFAREMEIKKSNAKIGEIEDTESTYSLTVD
jgi:hypothetical protein